MKLELNLNIIKRLAKQREKENFGFRAFLKGKSSDEVDKIVHRLHDEISSQIDCTSCGNCCSFLRPLVSDEEIDRLSEIDNISRENYEKQFVELTHSNDKYLKDMPCKYLKDKKCSIYPDRPEECRSYPFTHKDKFISRLFGVIDNYEICPIVFNLYERLKIIYRYHY